MSKEPNLDKGYRLTIIPPGTEMKDRLLQGQWHLFFGDSRVDTYTQDEAAHAGRTPASQNVPFVPQDFKPNIW